MSTPFAPSTLDELTRRLERRRSTVERTRLLYPNVHFGEAATLTATGEVSEDRPGVLVSVAARGDLCRRGPAVMCMAPDDAGQFAVDWQLPALSGSGS